MPWNDNANPGPWGAPDPKDDDTRKSSGPRRPTLGGGRGGGGPRGPNGPDLNEFVERLQQRLREFLGGPGGQIKPGAIAAGAGVIFAIWAASGVYIVQPNEQAVVTTFGAYSRSETPGLRYHLPAPIERVEKVPVTSLQRIDVGGAGENDVPEESLMLTGDENIVDIDFSVTWRVSDPSRFLFNVKDPEPSIKAVAESAMREVVGKSALEAVLTSGRGQVQTQAAELMQATLDQWRTGVTVVEVQIRTAGPPEQVVGAFREVATAGQNAESAVNEANTYRNRVVNEAKGDAARIVQAGQAYREQSVREASGEAARFDQIYAEYRAAPGVTRDRLYIETMQRVLARSNKVVVDSQGASAPIILPPDVFRPRAQPGQPQAPPPPQPAAPAAPAVVEGR